MAKAISSPVGSGLVEAARPASIDIAQVILNAHIFNFRRASVMEEELVQAVIDLFHTLEAKKIEYLLVGGVALLNYIEGRNTEDVDLILSASDVDALDELVILEREEDFVRGRWGSLRVDLLLTQNRLFEHVRKHCATAIDFRGQAIACSTVEGLVLLKFYALPPLYRQGDFDKVALYETDLTMLLHRYPVDMESILAELETHLSQGDVEELRVIYHEIEGRIRRFNTGP